MPDITLFHTHGLGPFDFSSLEPGELLDLDETLRQRGVVACPTIYLLQSAMDRTEAVLTEFAHLRTSGALTRILGFSIEGPILGPDGGVPRGSIWSPTPAQWRRIAGWGLLGLKYVVVAPDSYSLGDSLGDGMTFAVLLNDLYRHGVRVAMGHFSKGNPARSAERLEEVLGHLERRYQPSPYLVLTDHLFNDMPRSFTHAFRGHVPSAAREHEVARVLGSDWSVDKLPDLLGEVPASILVAAKAGRLTPALNFDGSHVDLAFCERVIQFLGSGRVIGMTDHTETTSLAGERLVRSATDPLLYRSDGILAASAVSTEDQIDNMIDIGIPDVDILDVFGRVPLEALTFEPQPYKED